MNTFVIIYVCTYLYVAKQMWATEKNWGTDKIMCCRYFGHLALMKPSVKIKARLVKILCVRYICSVTSLFWCFLLSTSARYSVTIEQLVLNMFKYSATWIYHCCQYRYLTVINHCIIFCNTDKYKTIVHPHPFDFIFFYSHK